jgi:hypothetical protein
MCGPLSLDALDKRQRPYRRYRESIKDRADEFRGVAPLWHGWAIMDAFLAGIDYARKQKSEIRQGSREALLQDPSTMATQMEWNKAQTRRHVPSDARSR